MAFIQFFFALIGLTIFLFAVIRAIRNREKDRWAEGLLVGLYVGALGAVSLLAILSQVGLLQR
jgi:NhaP-type Na+/H+ or K+/H+ antiporter